MDQFYVSAKLSQVAVAQGASFVMMTHDKPVGRKPKTSSIEKRFQCCSLFFFNVKMPPSSDKSLQLSSLQQPHPAFITTVGEANCSLYAQGNLKCVRLEVFTMDVTDFELEISAIQLRGKTSLLRDM